MCEDVPDRAWYNVGLMEERMRGMGNFSGELKKH
jgi:hypothetical protein